LIRIKWVDFFNHLDRTSRKSLNRKTLEENEFTLRFDFDHENAHNPYSGRKLEELSP